MLLYKRRTKEEKVYSPIVKKNKKRYN